MYQEENYLAHHGILGQKWGVRRYQNYDGSLTALGRKRRGLTGKGGAVDKTLKAIGKAQKARQQNKARKAAEYEKAKAKAEQEEIERKARKTVSDHEKLKDSLRRNPKGIYKNRSQLTPEEVDEIMKSVAFDRKCKDIKRDEYLRGLRTVKDISDTAKTFHDLLDNSTKMYNDAALIYNAMLDARGETGAKRIKKIAWDDSGKQKKKNKAEEEED